MFFDKIDRWLEIIGLLSLPILGIVVGYIAGRYKRYLAQNAGEAQVRQSLVKYCKNKDAHVLNHVTIPLEDGSTTQIDHILLSAKGIFVIETKQYRGWIFANPKSKFWTQIIFHTKFRFQNPIHQNHKHVKSIRKLLDFLEPKFIHNIVVFSGDAVFKTHKPNNVCYIDELITAIEQYPDSALSLNRVQFCVGRLEYIRLELIQKTDVEHHAYLMQKFGS